MNVSRTKRSIGNLPDFAIFAPPGRLRAGPAAAGDLARTLMGRHQAVATWAAGVAVAAAILGAIPAAHGQNTPATAAPQSSSAPTSSAPASSSTSTSDTPPAAGDTAAGKAAPAGQSTGGKTDPVCFKLTGHCVDSSKVSGSKAGTAAAKTGSTDKKLLNLTAPDVRTVVPEEELKEPLPSTDQITETQESQTVSVKGEQGVPPDVPVGLGAIWWAVGHPSQAWRILTPAE